MQLNCLPSYSPKNFIVQIFKGLFYAGCYEHTKSIAVLRSMKLSESSGSIHFAAALLCPVGNFTLNRSLHVNWWKSGRCLDNITAKTRVSWPLTNSSMWGVLCTFLFMLCDVHLAPLLPLDEFRSLWSCIDICDCFPSVFDVLRCCVLENSVNILCRIFISWYHENWFEKWLLFVFLL